MLAKIHEFWWKFKILQNFRILINFYGKDKNPLDFQISWDVSQRKIPKLSNFSENDFPKVRKKLEVRTQLELEENPF